MPNTFLKVCQFSEFIPYRQEYKKPLRQALPFQLYQTNNSMVIAGFFPKIDSKLFLNTSLYPRQVILCLPFA